MSSSNAEARSVTLPAARLSYTKNVPHWAFGSNSTTAEDGSAIYTSFAIGRVFFIASDVTN